MSNKTKSIVCLLLISLGTISAPILLVLAILGRVNAEITFLSPAVISLSLFFIPDEYACDE